MDENEARDVHEPYQITLYVDKEQYKKFRAILVLADKSVSQWVREKINEALHEAPWKAASRPSEPTIGEENDE